MHDISRMRTFHAVPNPSTTPRIQARQDIQKINRDHQAFMVLFWDFFQQLEGWRQNIEERVKAIEEKIPHI